MINYKIFENLQQAEKLINDLKQNWEDNPPNKGNQHLYKDREQKLRNYEKLKTYLKSKKSLGYLHLLTRVLFSSGGHENHLNKIKEYVELILKYGIKINLDKYLSFKDHKYKHRQFYVDILNEISLIQTNKFIDKWAPGFLKKDLKSNYKEKLRDVFFDMLETQPHYYKDKNPFDKIDTSLLRGKMSMFKSAQDWFKYVIDEEGEIEESDNLKIYYEDDEWVIYRPFDYESMNIIKFPKWCTIVEDQFIGRTKEGYHWIVLYNKKSKKDSHIVEFNTYYSDGNPSKNCFTIHNYHDIIISRLICKLDDNIKSLITKDEIFKIFFNLEIIRNLI